MFIFDTGKRTDKVRGCERRSIKASELKSALMKNLEEFRDVEIGQMKTIIDDVAKETVKELKMTSPQGATGNYRKGWKRKKTYENAVKERVVVYEEKPEYRKTHLLENGHDIKRGGKTIGHASAKPHIKMAEEKAAESIMARLKRL